MLDIPDIRGLELEDAKEIVFGFVTTLKKTEQAIASAKEELAQWQSRAQLAQDKGHPDLVSAATEKVRELTEKIAGLETERDELAPVVNKLKQDLHMARSGVGLNYDPDYLAAEVEVMLGDQVKDNAVKKEIESLSVDDELAALKKKMFGPKEGE
jgi:phage shock protein A